MRRVVTPLVLAALMMAVASGVYLSLVGAQASVSARARKPTDVSAVSRKLILPGTLVLAQSGALYSLTGGRFRQLTAEEGWTQPSFTADGNALVAVRAAAASSDVYELSLDGVAGRQLTRNAAPDGADPGANHWSFYPRPSADGRQLFLSYDAPKFGFEVGFSIWAVPSDGTLPQGRQWTIHNEYTGGDVQPLPLPSGALLYTKHSLDPSGRMTAQLYLTREPLTRGKALTAAADACSQAALSPDGRTLAMICTRQGASADLVLAPLEGESLTPLSVVASGTLAQPTWAPDGSGLAYLAPAVPGGAFQLWWLSVSAPGADTGPTASPEASDASTSGVPVQVTSGLALDATSSLAWRH